MCLHAFPIQSAPLFPYKVFRTEVQWLSGLKTREDIVLKWCGQEDVAVLYLGYKRQSNRSTTISGGLSQAHEALTSGLDTNGASKQSQLDLFKYFIFPESEVGQAQASMLASR
jgi:hypothetical protein